MAQYRFCWMVLVLVGLACASMPSVSQVTTGDIRYQFFPGATRREPTPLHELIYAAMESCSGRSGDYHALNWWTSPFILEQPRGTEVFGFWSDDAIANDYTELGRVVVTKLNFSNNPGLLSHEILHDLYGPYVVPMDVAMKCVIRHTGFPPGG